MPKIRKAARGKHRWIGLALGKSDSEIESVRSEIMELLGYTYVKLYDFIIDSGRKSCIIKVKLEKYPAVRERFKNYEGSIISVTSSGKIRLVRLRLEEYFQRQIDD
jgi:hypothetical protein